MAQELNEVDQQLAKDCGWKPPRYPYIAFRFKKVQVLGDLKRETDLERETGLRAYDTIIEMNVKGVHRQVSKLQAIIRNKKFRVVGWGNFPAPESQLARATKQGPNDNDDWTELDAFCKREYGQKQVEDKTISGLRQKVAELEAKNKKAA